jgi:hypothetical protein
MDTVYRPISDDSEEETPSPQTDLPIESYSEFRKAVNDYNGASDHDLSSEEVADDITPRRQREQAPTAENASERPLVRMRSTGDGPLTLQEASDDIRFSRARQLGADLRETGYSQEQINEVAVAKNEAALDGLPDNPDPPVEVKLPPEFGEEKDRPLSATEAADKLTDWRQEQEATRQAELAALVGSQEQTQAEAQQAQPTEQPQLQPQAQPTPEQSERAQLAQERQRITHIKRMDGVEASWRHNYDQLCEAAAREFPSLRNGPPDPAHVEQLRQQDPARFQRLAQYDAALRDRQQKIAALTQQRITRDQQQQQAASAERAAARAEQDRAFEQIAAQHIPNWDRVHGEVRAQAKKTLVNAGLSEAQIHHLWSGDHDGIDVHSSVLQLILAKAAQWDLATEKARQVRQAPVPPVQRPGTYRAPDSGQSLHALQAQLRGATGRRALEIATEITRARRESGG